MSVLFLVARLAAVVSDASIPHLAPPPATDFTSLSTADVPPTPPEMPSGVGSRAHVEAMVEDAIGWCALNGLMVKSAGDGPLFTHAPFSLLPAAYPANALEQAKKLAPIFGTLLDAIGRDVPWLARTLKDAADADEFTRRLLKLCAQVQREGATQPARLAILRSDYVLHQPEGASSARLLQVELNTIAAGLGALSARVGALHTALCARWPGARQHVWQAAGEPRKFSLRQVLPPSGALEALAAALARAHALYGVPDALVLFVVQPEEIYALDQAALAQQLWNAHGVRSVRRTLSQLAFEAKLEGRQRRLHLMPERVEVAVVYLWAGYAPEDYPSARQWEARTLLERSHAIKCPCIEHQLAGSKQVQQQLTRAGELERFVDEEACSSLRAVFAGLWTLSGPMNPTADAPPREHEAAQRMRLAAERPSEYVIAPECLRVPPMTSFRCGMATRVCDCVRVPPSASDDLVSSLCRASGT
jgi:glutathione synthase